ncbi:MAG: hypothetical protein JWN24_3361 [Phycisphaerales bacterium]|nr:hypothetical protein [Phycisphaerales bacterium]
MSALAGPPSSCAGFFQGRPVLYPHLLAEAPPPDDVLSWLPEEWRMWPGWREIWDRKVSSLESLGSRLSRLHTNSRGYCGWLLTNSQFLEEHDALFEKWAEQIRTYDLPKIAPLGAEVLLQDTSEPAPQCRDYANAFFRFLERWQLGDLAGPYLPEPVQFQFPVLLSDQRRRLVRAGGTLLCVPKSSPVPDRELLREMAEDAHGRQQAPEHLRGWARVVDGSNRAKTRIARYARLFVLQHYWAVLHHRWGERLRGHNERLHAAFAIFLFAEEEDPDLTRPESIRKDLQLISRCLGGTNWPQRRAALGRH